MAKKILMKSLINYFIRGLFYTVPIGITIYLVVTSIAFLDQLIPIRIPGVGLLIMLIFITFMGYLGSVVLASSIGNLVRRGEKFIQRIPGVKMIYFAIKDLTSALTGSSKTFDHAVLVMLDKENNIEKIGFVTKNDLTPMGISDDKVSVYFPYSYGIMGDLRIVPRTSVKALEGKASEIMKFVVSGGVVNIGESTSSDDEVSA
jgi:uncharacterized membrane protein